MDEVHFKPEKFVQVLQQVLQPPTENQRPQQVEIDMKSIMAAMDEELGETTVRTTFVDQPHQHSDGDPLQMDDSPLDLDFDVVKHLLESVSQEHGLPGPASTLLNELYKGSHKKKK
jgi:hypothetical protein